MKSPPTPPRGARTIPSTTPATTSGPAWTRMPSQAAQPGWFHAHHLRYFARQLAAHADPRNRAVHLVATLVGFQCLVSMLARVSVGPTNLGALLAVATVLYFLPFEPLAALLVGAATLASRLLLGPRWGQAGVAPALGLGVALAVFLGFNLTGVYTHRLFDDPIIDSGSREKLPVRLGKTLHTILFSSVHFVTFGLGALGYRPRLRRQIEARLAPPTAPFVSPPSTLRKDL